MIFNETYQTMKKKAIVIRHKKESKPILINLDGLKPQKKHNNHLAILSFEGYIEMMKKELQIYRICLVNVKRHNLAGSIVELNPKVCKIAYIIWRHHNKVDIVVILTAKLIYHLLNNPMKTEAQFSK
jgi:hypothetical protein